jgi:hypothetical protein
MQTVSLRGLPVIGYDTSRPQYTRTKLWEPDAIVQRCLHG